MALVVEDGSGLSNAESYASVAEADAYFAAYGLPEAWLSSTPGEKEIALRRATQWLEARYRSRWTGVKKLETQALAWPRLGFEDEDGYFVSDASVPALVKRATAELAWRYRARSSDLMGDMEPEDSSIASETLTVGPITEQKSYRGAKETSASFPLVEGILEPLLGRGNRLRFA